MSGLCIADFSEGVLRVLKIQISHTVYTLSNLFEKNQLNIKYPLHTQHYSYNKVQLFILKEYSLRPVHN